MVSYLIPEPLKSNQNEDNDNCPKYMEQSWVVKYNQLSKQPT